METLIPGKKNFNLFSDLIARYFFLGVVVGGVVYIFQRKFILSPDGPGLKLFLLWTVLCCAVFAVLLVLRAMFYLTVRDIKFDKKTVALKKRFSKDDLVLDTRSIEIKPYGRIRGLGRRILIKHDGKKISLCQAAFSLGDWEKLEEHLFGIIADRRIEKEEKEGADL